MQDLDSDEGDMLIACVDLIGRSGAKGFEVGYLHDNVPIAEADWWAHAQYKGARVSVEHLQSPHMAAQALAEKLLTGAKCNHCKGLIALKRSGAFAFVKTTLVDGSTWTADEAARTSQCLWKRVGQKWIRGCE